MTLIAENTADTATNIQAEQIIMPVITITENAHKQIRRVMARKAIPGAFLRVGVRGGGCSGLSYVLKPDTEFDAFDRTWVEENGLRVVIDRKSITFLEGTTIDYDIKNLMEGGFIFRNPNAVKSCGCGTSFTPK